MLKNYKIEKQTDFVRILKIFLKHKSAFVTEYGNGETEVFLVKQTSHEPDKDVLSEK